MADSRSAPDAGIPGVVSRAVSACTEIMEMWWATTSCSSREMRARSPRAVCSSTVSAITWRVALTSNASPWARRAIPARTAAGVTQASSSVSTRASPPGGSSVKGTVRSAAVRRTAGRREPP